MIPVQQFVRGIKWDNTEYSRWEDGGNHGDDGDDGGGGGDDGDDGGGGGGDDGDDDGGGGSGTDGDNYGAEMPIGRCRKSAVCLWGGECRVDRPREFWRRMFMLLLLLYFWLCS